MPDLMTGRFPQISTVFDQSNDSPHSLLYSGSVRNALLKLLPPDFFFSEEDAGEEFCRNLPLIKWFEWGGDARNLSIFLLCRHRINGVKFFYEMISRWLLPGKRPHVASFFSTDFTLPEFSDDLFTVSEIVIALESEADLASTRHQLPILESEMHLGLKSVYHASRILEIKGLSADEKTSLIQGRITSLLERRPNDFDPDIFTQMQHFLVMCSEEFKAIREYAHMSRIIYVFYLFKKTLRDEIEKNGNQRFIHVKLSKTCLHLPFGVKKVLGIFSALNFLNDSELFGERHFSRILKAHFPQLAIVEDSFFSLASREERSQLLYLEVEKKDGADFTLEESKHFKLKLPEEIRNGIEKLARPLFMPRNEEEVMRNIITLSNQLKNLRDLPQVVINFDEQTQEGLSFTVICLRVLKETDASLSDLFVKRSSVFKFIPDRVKKMGVIRKKYPKEATVFRVRLSSHSFLRPDHSVDLYKARQAIVKELHHILGEFRDFNGGMIAKQQEQFLSLKSLMADLGHKEELLLENFFHSIFPIELRSLFNPLPLKILFTMLLEAVQKGQKILSQCDQEYCYFLLSYDDTLSKDRAADFIRSLQIPSSQLLTLSLHTFETFYFGAIYREEDKERREKFLNGVSQFQK
ncbi:MAG: hypothetical protein HYX67_16295 [Candidatus Melainabacteria bacterium]|nr:hypothetical protein [Candidatus Melainabacteria bacterium]